MLLHEIYIGLKWVNNKWLQSRHKVVCHVAQKNRARVNVRVSILTETTKSQFSRICSSVMSSPNGIKFTVDLFSLHAGEATFQIWTRSLKPFPRYEWANFHKKFLHFFFLLCHFAHFTKIAITRTRAPIWLKFGTRNGGLKANISIKIGVNLINIQGVISDFTHKAVKLLSRLQGKLLRGISWKSVCS